MRSQKFYGGGGVATSVASAAFPLLAPDGSQGAPSYSLSNASGVGFWRNSSGYLACSDGLTDVWFINTGSNYFSIGRTMDLTGATRIRGSAGTAGSPVYSTDGGATGMFGDVSNECAFTTNGTEAARFDTNQRLTLEGDLNYKQTAAADSTAATFVNLPTGGTAAQVGWLDIQVNGTTSYVPYWQ